MTKKKRPRSVSMASAMPIAAKDTPPERNKNSNDGNNSNDNDQGIWSKSKKKRMRLKQKKDEERQKKMAQTSSGSGRSSTNNDGGNANNRNNNGDASNNGDVNRNKRQRVNPPESSSTSSNAPGKIASAKVSEQINPATPVDNNEQNAPDATKKKKNKKKKKKPNQEDQSVSTPDSSTALPGENTNAPAVTPDIKPLSKKKNKNKPNGKTTDNKDNNSATNNNDTKTDQPESSKPTPPKLKVTPPKMMSTLQKAFLERLTSSRFRELNEELYTHSSQHSFQYFTDNPDLFEQYHVGFRKQVKEWPVNPVDVIWKKIVGGWKKQQQQSQQNGTDNDDGNEKKKLIVADFGCGDAKLAERLLSMQISSNENVGSNEASKSKKKKKNKSSPNNSWCPFEVHSFDLVSGGNPLVTPADMCNVPLPKESIDVGVYSLALMGTNVADFVREAWRVLKFGGCLRVAEVRSRFETASGGDMEEGGGGKRGKSNNGQKHQRNASETNKDNNGAESTQPLMLIDEFLSLMERCGFECTNLDRNNKMFVFMDFIKVDGSRGLSDKERFSAKPCIYKRR